MPQAKLLIADDETPVRTALSAALDEFGYEVRGAENGFAALAEIRREIPDLIIADLHMPHMSGFELLSVVRRRFPSIGAIAMSGSYSSDGVPPGVAAEAFYEKGTHPGLLFRIVKAMTQAERRPAREGPNPSGAHLDSAQRARPGRTSVRDDYVHGMPEDVPAGSRRGCRNHPGCKLRLLLEPNSVRHRAARACQVAAGFSSQAGLGLAHSAGRAEPLSLKRRARHGAEGAWPLEPWA